MVLHLPARVEEGGILRGWCVKPPFAGHGHRYRRHLPRLGSRTRALARQMGRRAAHAEGAHMSKSISTRLIALCAACVITMCGGGVAPSASETPPPGYVLADGRCLSGTDFPVLRKEVGRSGCPSGYFALPDLRGKARP